METGAANQQNTVQQAHPASIPTDPKTGRPKPFEQWTRDEIRLRLTDDDVSDAEEVILGDRLKVLASSRVAAQARTLETTVLAVFREAAAKVADPLRRMIETSGNKGSRQPQEAIIQYQDGKEIVVNYILRNKGTASGLNFNKAK